MLKIEEVIQILQDFLSDPQNNQSKYDKLKSALVIQKYLPLNVKVVIVYLSLLENDFGVDFNPVMFVARIDISLIFNGLLSYTNIEKGESKEYKTYENYDLLYQTGLVDYILTYCKEDFERLYKMTQEAISFSNIEKLTEALSMLDTEKVDKLTEEFKKFRTELDPQIIENISDIVRYNDPTLLQIKTDVVDDILDKLDTAERTINKNKK